MSSIIAEGSPRPLNQINVALGTMTIGPTAQISDVVMASDFVGRYNSWCRDHGMEPTLDTARMYDKGETEARLGQLPEKSAGVIDTKVNPWGDSGENSLNAESIASQFDESITKLGVGSVNVLYLHAPDTSTPILESLHAINVLFQAGKIRAFGLSNYQAWEVAHIHALCTQNGLLAPSIYQGMYNCITREVERELLPCLRALGMRFYAYNQLAGGLLTGKYTAQALRGAEVAAGSRFTSSNRMYRERYLKEAQLQAAEIVVAACRAAEIPPAVAATVWVARHSALRYGPNGDAIIVGASSVAQLDVSLTALDASTSHSAGSPCQLPSEVLTAMDEAWEMVQGNGCCPSYERGYSFYSTDTPTSV